MAATKDLPVCYSGGTRSLFCLSLNTSNFSSSTNTPVAVQFALWSLANWRINPQSFTSLWCETRARVPPPAIPFSSSRAAAADSIAPPRASAPPPCSCGRTCGRPSELRLCLGEGSPPPDQTEEEWLHGNDTVGSPYASSVCARAGEIRRCDTDQTEEEVFNAGPRVPIPVPPPPPHRRHHPRHPKICIFPELKPLATAQACCCCRLETATSSGAIFTSPPATSSASTGPLAVELQ